MQIRVGLIVIRRWVTIDWRYNMRREIDVKFAKYLQGKSVAIVGRASYLRYLKQADWIDSHDVVARLHKGVPYDGTNGHPTWYYNRAFVDPDLQRMMGSRVNVFIKTLHDITDVDLAKDILKAFKEAGGKFITNELPYHGDCKFVNPEVEKLVGEVRTFSWEDERELQRAIGAISLTGTNAIADIINHDVGPVYITGIPCFLDIMDAGKRPELLPEEITKEVCVKNLRYIHSIVRQRNITVDDTMSELFLKYC